MRLVAPIYAIAALVIAALSLVFETYPALFFIDLMAPNPGDRYSVTLALALTFLVLILPLALILLVQKQRRKAQAQNTVVDAGRTGAYLLRRKHLSGALVAAPVMINGKEAGLIDSGSRLFFDLPVGMVEVQVGKGAMRSEVIQLQVKEGEQFNLEARIAQGAFKAKYVLAVL